MTDTKNVYKKTGNNLSVSRDELINTTVKKLIYYNSLSQNKKQNISNPFVDPIYIKLSDEKMIEVPRIIQNNAITKFNIGIPPGKQAHYTHLNKKILKNKLKTYFENFKSKQEEIKVLKFGLLLSLQIQIIGILVCFIIFVNSATPPRSPDDIPSTSSIINTVLFFNLLLPKYSCIVQLPEVSFTTFCIVFLLRVSLAFISRISYPHSTDNPADHSGRGY
jgi:ribosomal protein L10